MKQKFELSEASRKIKNQKNCKKRNKVIVRESEKKNKQMLSNF